MEQSSSASQRQPSSRFTNTNDKHSSEAGLSRPDVSTTTNEKTTSLKSPRPWNYYSSLSGDDDYDDDRPNLRSKSTNIVTSLRTSSLQQSTSRKRKAPSGIEPPSKLIIHESCIPAGALSSNFQSIKTKVELLGMQYPDDLPYTVTYSRNHKILYLECQECNKSFNLLKGLEILAVHASSDFHSACVDERLRKLEADGFRRQLTKEVMAREKTMHSSRAFTTTMGFQRPCRPKQASRQQFPELAPSENFESISVKEEVAEKSSHSQPDTDRIAILQEEIKTLTTKVTNLAGFVENHELLTSHSSTANDAALIEDLKKSKGTMMKRLATSEERLAVLEEQNDRLVSKIKELERR
ncbi:uncharacterized protein EAE97_002675 [Botrytis byssoidea]|uniref:Uncharacterized protein n=1 Tax=Botrytis byssoidea TaxID=139641 RepID=A0A9P5M2M8_9HELO|nr:uncharacterized protein EAE97_002675 [Botrytis byssoidea]KAF7951124.1 hypothetical protein EAE97_002675 [Botrytis byssoidea]